MTKTLIFTATYNEINNIKKLINKIYKINKFFYVINFIVCSSKY